MKHTNRIAANRLLFIALPLAGVLLLGLSGYMAVRSLRPRVYRVRMLTDIVPTPAMMARRIAENAGRHGVVVEFESKPVTSLEALDLIDRPNPIDVALVPGGVTEREYANVRQVAELATDPMHLLIRADLSARGLPALRGKRINLGPPRSVTNALARDLLSFAGLNPAPAGAATGGDFLATNLTPADLQRAVARLQTLSGEERERALAELPEGVFVLAPVPSLLVRELVVGAGYRLVPIAFADAYCLDRLNPTSVDGVAINRSIMEPWEIPAFTYGIDPEVPAAPCRTVATHLIVIAYAATDAESVNRLLETVYDGQLAGLLGARPLNGLIPIFPLHRGAELYQRRNEPFVTPEMLSGLGKAAGGFGAFASGIVAFYGFLRLRQLRRFEAYYEDLRRLELIARGHEDDPEAPREPPARRAYLEERLLDLKSQALRDFADGGLKGEGLMSGIVSLVNDTRSSIDRIGREADS